MPCLMVRFSAIRRPTPTKRRSPCLKICMLMLTPPPFRFTFTERSPIHKPLVTRAMLNARCSAIVVTAWRVTPATDLGGDGTVRRDLRGLLVLGGKPRHTPDVHLSVLVHDNESPLQPPVRTVSNQNASTQAPQATQTQQGQLQRNESSRLLCPR